MALTGFLVAHQCAPTATDAIRILQADYPLVAGSQPLMLTVSSATFTAPNTFNLTITAHSLVGNPQYILSHPFTLAMCDPALPVDVGITPFDPVVAGAFFSIALVFTVGIWMIAKQGGEILSVVKWW